MFSLLRSRFAAAASALFEGGYTSAERRPISLSNAGPFHRQVPTGSWKQMLANARFLYANSGAISGAIHERAFYAVGNAWIPQYAGTNPHWGNKAEAWLWEWMKICDVRGKPFDFRTNLALTSIALDRDADSLTLLTYTRDDYPMVQNLPSYRVGNRDGFGEIQSGPYTGLGMRNGVILNKNSAAVAVRVLGDTAEEDRDISLRDAHLNFSPRWFDQGRGLPGLATGINTWSDIRDILDFEKLAQKAFSAHTFIETNETGAVDPGKAWIQKGAAKPGAGRETDSTTIEGGLYRILKSGSRLEAVETGRPSPAWQGFIAHLLREGFAAMDWPYELWDGSKTGGADVRLRVVKAMRSTEDKQIWLGHLALRQITYALAKAIKLGILPSADDWWNWDFQVPTKLSVDAGYEAAAERDDYKLGFTTLSQVVGKRGGDWQEVIRQKVRERRFLLDECAKSGVKPEEIQLLTPNGNPAGPNESQSTGQGDTGSDSKGA